MLLEEFDANNCAVINAFELIKPIENFPKIAVSCFEYRTFEKLRNEINADEIIAYVSVANMKIPIYRANYKGVYIALFMSYVGASGCVGVLEEVFAFGLEKLVLFGTCGVLDATIKDCSVIIPTSAMRDEGTSYHYAPPSDEIEVNKKYKDEFIELLDTYSCSYTLGKVWTTDAFYRETREKANRRKECGCVCVDMECSAVAAFAGFREKEIFHFFYATDNLDSEQWDERSLKGDKNVLVKDRIALLAMEFAIKI